MEIWRDAGTKLTRKINGARIGSSCIPFFPLIQFDLKEIHVHKRMPKASELDDINNGLGMWDLEVMKEELHYVRLFSHWIRPKCEDSKNEFAEGIEKPGSYPSFLQKDQFFQNFLKLILSQPGSHLTKKEQFEISQIKER